MRDSNFTHANRITEGDPKELVPVVQPDLGTFLLQTGDNLAHGFTTAIDVEIVVNGVYIAGNVGGCLRVSLFPKLPESYIQLKLKDVVVHNFLVLDKLLVMLFS